MSTADRLRMPLGEALFTQRAIRHLKTDPVSDQDLETLLTAAARAPSGGNRQPWRFLADATCCIPLGWPEGRFGPAKRKPLSEIAFVDHFGTAGPWTREAPIGQ